MRNIWTNPVALPWVSLNIVPNVILADALRAFFQGLGYAGAAWAVYAVAV